MKDDEGRGGGRTSTRRGEGGVEHKERGGGWGGGYWADCFHAANITQREINSVDENIMKENRTCNLVKSIYNLSKQEN
jgi:hypothetical protein